LKVLISDPVDQQCVRLLEKEGLEVDVRTHLSPEELKQVIGQYSALIVRSGTKVTADLIQAAQNMRVIGRAGSGVDNIDVAAATKQGIVVMNTPGGNTISAAEHTISLLFALSRNIPQAMESLRRGKWDRKRYTGVEIYGKTLGIIGLGKVGREVALRARGLGMKLLGYDPFISEEAVAKIGVKLANLDEIYSQSDYITIHTPLTKETRHLISDAELDRCKKGVRIINCARGGIVDEAALLRALEKGKVAGAALDVFEKEPPEDNPLIKQENVICTPHLGASTREAQANVAVQIAEQIADALIRDNIRNALNLPSVEPSVYQALRPYLLLGEKIGSLHAQLAEGHLQKISVEYCGDVLAYPISPLTSSILKGIFQDTGEGTVNLVNAPVIAEERGVRIEEIRSSEHKDFSNLITVRCVTDMGRRLISGTVFGKSNLRIVGMDGYDFDSWPQGNMLICANQDVPGVIGSIGTILGDAGINIARMSWAREEDGQKAMTMLNVDSPIPDEILEKIISEKHVLWAKRAVL